MHKSDRTSRSHRGATASSQEADRLKGSTRNDATRGTSSPRSQRAGEGDSLTRIGAGGACGVELTHGHRRSQQQGAGFAEAHDSSARTDRSPGIAGSSSVAMSSNRSIAGF